MNDLIGWAGFLATFGLPFTLYVAAQVVALLRLRGRARAWSALPIPVMIWAVWKTADAYRHDSNLWPLPLIFLGLVALMYLGVVLLVVRARGERALRQQER